MNYGMQTTSQAYPQVVTGALSLAGAQAWLAQSTTLPVVGPVSNKVVAGVGAAGVAALVWYGFKKRWF